MVTAAMTHSSPLTILQTLGSADQICFNLVFKIMFVLLGGLGMLVEARRVCQIPWSYSYRCL